MLHSLFIQNFRAWENQTFTFNGEHVVFAGGSASGKSSVLQALDLFFNRDAIDSPQVRDPEKDVSIGIRFDGTTYKKTFSCKTHQVKSRTPAASWKKVEGIHYIYLPATSKTSAAILTELAQAKADSLLSPEISAQLARVAQQAMDEVLSAVGTAATKRNPPVTAVPKVLPARAVDFTIMNNGVPVAGAELGYSKNLTYAMLVGSRYDNVVLGIDDVERAFAAMDYQKVIRNLEEHVGQVLMTTRSSQVMQHVGREVTVPVGSAPDGNMASILRGLEGDGKAFVLVEGKYDLPWYKEAAELSGFGRRVHILPAGGTNIDELQREMATVGMKCVAIVDGDTPPSESTGKFALVRECVELYTPDELLRSLFGTVPPISGKREFFAAACAARRCSENGVKAAIAENIAAHLTPNSEFVREVGALLKRALEA